MGKDYAKFMATTANKIVFGDKDVELKLAIPHKVAQQNLEFLTSSLNKEIQVLLGDPQASFDFEDQGDDMYRKWTGRRVTADASGVVISAQKPEPEHDENQAEMFGPEQAEDDTPAGDDQAEQGEQEQTDQAGQDEQPGDQEGEGAFDDIPEWMREVGDDQEGETGEENGQRGDDSAPREMNFGEDESSGAAEGSDQEHEAPETIEIDKDTLENYILEKRPVFEDLTLDFPALYEQKRKEGVTWRDIAVGVGMTTGQLNTQLTKYKGRVKEQMTQSTAV
ncbi:hypothetical protein [Paenibacillus polymyxa]|uniref:Uncharacterized protein n=1 Tax=Paenibacillus polymyxa (strain SC2) TaxID=886882 RepID=E3E590_PAEPS|nr:hypothetical protein [Paenibacillus polymyxa]ADO57450.1 hypothetical protein PPSC2_16355 [Paenibacillus polymyxa SC2]WPQ55222.1 hypothetical protein SKN87_16670 [Paenibacillus polymyxa]CCI70115.1 hypothetical protein PPM_3306 [Paenibacillus polymyxa M1]